MGWPQQRGEAWEPRVAGTRKWLYNHRRMLSNEWLRAVEACQEAEKAYAEAGGTTWTTAESRDRLLQTQTNLVEQEKKRAHLDDRGAVLFKDGTQHRLGPAEIEWNKDLANQERRAGQLWSSPGAAASSTVALARAAASRAAAEGPEGESAVLRFPWGGSKKIPPEREVASSSGKRTSPAPGPAPVRGQYKQRDEEERNNEPVVFVVG